MSPASIGGGLHSRLSVAGNNLPPKPGRSRSSAGAVASYATGSDAAFLRPLRGLRLKSCPYQRYGQGFKRPACPPACIGVLYLQKSILNLIFMETKRRPIMPENIRVSVVEVPCVTYISQATVRRPAFMKIQKSKNA